MDKGEGEIYRPDAAFYFCNLPIGAQPEFCFVLFIGTGPSRVQPRNSNANTMYLAGISPDKSRIIRRKVEQTVTGEEITIISKSIHPSTPLLFPIPHCGNNILQLSGRVPQPFCLFWKYLISVYIVISWDEINVTNRNLWFKCCTDCI